MLRIEVALAGTGYSYDKTLFEKKLRREILRLVADLGDQYSSVEIARVQITKPKR